MELARLILVMCGLLIANPFIVSFVLCDKMEDDAETTSYDLPMTQETFTGDRITEETYSNDTSVTPNLNLGDQTYTGRDMEDRKQLNFSKEHIFDVGTESGNYGIEKRSQIVVSNVSTDLPKYQSVIFTKPAKALKEPLSTSLTATYYITEAPLDKDDTANATGLDPMNKLVNEKALEHGHETSNMGKDMDSLMTENAALEGHDHETSPIGMDLSLMTENAALYRHGHETSTVRKDLSLMTENVALDGHGHETSTMGMDLSLMTENAALDGKPENNTSAESTSSKIFEDNSHSLKPKSGRLLDITEEAATPSTTRHNQMSFTPKYNVGNASERLTTTDEDTKMPRVLLDKADSEAWESEKNIEELIAEPPAASFTASEVMSRSETGTERTIEESEAPTDYIRKVITDDNTEGTHISRESSTLSEDMRADNYPTQSMEASSRANKRIGVKEEDMYTDLRRRPVQPAVASSRPELVRPPRPDTPLHHFSYFRPPAPDSRVPTIKQEPDQTRPARPSTDNKQVSNKPNFGRPTPEEIDSARPSYQYPRPSQDSNPQKPNFSRPPAEINNHFGISRPTSPRPSFKPNRGKPNMQPTGFGQPYNPSIVKRPQGSSTATAAPTISTVKYYTAPPVHAIKGQTTTASTQAPYSGTRTRPSSYYPKPNYGVNYNQPSFATTATPIKSSYSGTVSYNRNSTKMGHIDTECYDTSIKVKMSFHSHFDGVIYSSGYSHDSSCSYVNGTGLRYYEFYIMLDRCGTLGQREMDENTPELYEVGKRKGRSQYLVNMVTVQYNSLIEKRTDEHFRVACEYPLDYWKTLSFPVLSIAPDVRPRTGNPVVFNAQAPQCNMEILEGNGRSGIRVKSPIQVGDLITLVIHMRSETKGFDIRISSCYAHNGGEKRLQIVDTEGCVTEEKLLTEFTGVSYSNESTLITLKSQMNAFRFTGSPALYIECSVHMCHNSCPDRNCNWRRISKRSVGNNTEMTSTTDLNSPVSESVSLFQALEVRHDEEDGKNSMASRHPREMEENVTCMKTSALATLLAILLLALCGMALVCCLNCLRLKRVKSSIENAQYDGFSDRIPMR